MIYNEDLILEKCIGYAYNYEEQKIKFYLISSILISTGKI